MSEGRAKYIWTVGEEASNKTMDRIFELFGQEKLGVVDIVGLEELEAFIHARAVDILDVVEAMIWMDEEGKITQYWRIFYDITERGEY
jgi:hypothetical protein